MKIASMMGRIMWCQAPSNSLNPMTLEQMQEAQILVITHRAYEMALDRSYRSEGGSWDVLNEWENGPRKLTVIDEALDVVQHHQVTVDEVSRTVGFIPQAVAVEYPEAMQGLNAMRDLLGKLAVIGEQRQQDGIKEVSRIVWRGDRELPPELDLSDLRRDLRGLPWDTLLLGRDSAKDRLRHAQRIDKTLVAVQALWSRWNYYARKGKLDTLNSAEVVLPEHIHGPVLLDATASQSLVWQLFGPKAEMVITPPAARSYANVTLHVSRKTNGLGKGAMSKDARDRCGRLLANLSENLEPSRKVFVCCHMAVEQELIGIDHPFAAFDVTHYGKVDGRNDWQEHDVAVIFGLPYRDTVWATNTYMAFNGPQTDEWLATAQDVRQELIQGQMVVNVVQAIIRVVGKSARDRADAVWGRVRVAGVDTRLPIAAWLAVVMAMEDDPAIAPHRYEYRNVQAAKVVHRMASGTHKVWERPQVQRVGTPDRPLWAEEQRRPPRVVAMHVYPQSRGRVLRRVGADLEGAVELLVDHQLGDVQAFKADLEAAGKLWPDPYPGLGVSVRRRPKGITAG